MFIVLEIQVSQDDKIAIIPTTYDNMNDALSRFYQTMVSATQSSCKAHTVEILDSTGNISKKETIYHEGGTVNE